MPEIDVDVEALRFIRAAIRRHLPDREVWAFGSRIRRATRPTSDLDLVVLGARVPLQTMGALRQELEDSTLAFQVDIVEWAALPASLREAIASDHAVVQAEEGGARRSPAPRNL